MTDKLMSGRWLLTITGAGVFAFCAITGKLTSETITAILMFVFQAYFGKVNEEKKV